MDSKASTAPNNDKPEEDPGGLVSCSSCNFEERYHYKGKEPPFARAFVFLEDGYIIRDPFSPPGNRQCLLIAGDCSMCGKAVCCSNECSLFYVKRFCLKCVRVNIGYFPSQVTAKLKS
ncbi:hypothetical protein FOCC_FOCC006867 [Frankliniella occidentalis]|uniref:Cysteine-rich DPF motif domain-containing protein 1 n=1 Tax=Frankliniella occidentalis TaxID=133901 RepID=A0A6J1T758_FRAOC|nr:cysteine-rich DPF motif domain-containing protein 1 [Frankliniella occidentalis]KAE8746372.1 hypothetical protein FOCC_FOCC006867 [Frankliniella occidentalis]